MQIYTGKVRGESYNLIESKDAGNSKSCPVTTNAKLNTKIKVKAKLQGKRNPPAKVSSISSLEEVNSPQPCDGQSPQGAAPNPGLPSIPAPTSTPILGPSPPQVQLESEIPRAGPATMERGTMNGANMLTSMEAAERMAKASLNPQRGQLLSAGKDGPLGYGMMNGVAHRDGDYIMRYSPLDQSKREMGGQYMMPTLQGYLMGAGPQYNGFTMAQLPMSEMSMSTEFTSRMNSGNLFLPGPASYRSELPNHAGILIHPENRTGKLRRSMTHTAIAYRIRALNAGLIHVGSFINAIRMSRSPKSPITISVRKEGEEAVEGKVDREWQRQQ